MAFSFRPSRYPPSHWGPVVAGLLIIGAMAFLIIGSWRLSDGLNGIVIDHTNPYIHFSETTSAQEVTDGIIYLVLGVACLVAIIVLLVKRRGFLFPHQEEESISRK
jgi:TRAP-type C4-dicarboxylate transport system permease small subunit